RRHARLALCPRPRADSALAGAGLFGAELRGNSGRGAFRASATVALGDRQPSRRSSQARRVTSPRPPGSERDPMRTWYRRLRGSGLRPKSAARPGPCRPTVESLEDRCLLSGAYLLTNLVSDLRGAANTADANLSNPWGIAASATGPLWVADNHTGLSTVYDGAGTPQALVVSVPPPRGGTPPSAPTGIVFNGTTDFVVSGGGKSGAAVFLFATEDGTIAGWSPAVDPTHAVLAVDNSGAGAGYKGLASGSNAGGNPLFATKLNAGAVGTLDKSFHQGN